MSTKIIPAVTLVFCDCCQEQIRDGHRRMSAALHLKRDGLYYQGSPVGDASIQMDLCDSCAMAMQSAICEVHKERSKPL